MTAGLGYLYVYAIYRKQNYFNMKCIIIRIINAAIINHRLMLIDFVVSSFDWVIADNKDSFEDCRLEFS